MRMGEESDDGTASEDRLASEDEDDEDNNAKKAQKLQHGSRAGRKQQPEEDGESDDDRPAKRRKMAHKKGAYVDPFASRAAAQKPTKGRPRGRPKKAVLPPPTTLQQERSGGGKLESGDAHGRETAKEGDALSEFAHLIRRPTRRKQGKISHNQKLQEAAQREEEVNEEKRRKAEEQRREAAESLSSNAVAAESRRNPFKDKRGELKRYLRATCGTIVIKRSLTSPAANAANASSEFVPLGRTKVKYADPNEEHAVIFGPGSFDNRQTRPISRAQLDALSKFQRHLHFSSSSGEDVFPEPAECMFFRGLQSPFDAVLRQPFLGYPNAAKRLQRRGQHGQDPLLTDVVESATNINPLSSVLAGPSTLAGALSPPRVASIETRRSLGGRPLGENPIDLKDPLIERQISLHPSNSGADFDFETT
ncbi:unnamed protein product [Amoebophrya sp. A25]|nr:unnamed protein product [Amoebophrya sp. A25]|eukprot:GSA25T00024520001.1